MTTYEFCADWIARNVSTGAKVLDYGCGAGQIVKLLRARGIDAWGCDVFYEGGDYSTDIPVELRPFIQRMQGDRIPFDAAAFDLVVSNQVMEHVPDLKAVTAEIARVLKPGGIALNVFPDRAVWREGHCGIPFLHWFPKGTTLRVYYAAALRRLGLGYHKKNLTAMQWARDFCLWLDNWTHYRPRAEIHRRLTEAIGKTSHAEEMWLRARFNGRFNGLPTALQRLIVRKMGGLVLISVRHQEPFASQ